MNILLLSAYDAASHRYWRTVLADAFPEHNWTVLTLPARYFSWRVRGNSLTWAFQQRSVLSAEYDLLIATSMVDLSALRGLAPQLCRCPTLVYFHENQFDYPDSGRQYPSVEPRLLSVYTALAADRIVFNSEYNRDTFFQGSNLLLSKMPDHVPTGLMERLKARSAVIPVPLSPSDFACSAALPSTVDTDTPLSIVWNHRWEFDKAPERLFAALKQVLAQGIEVYLYLLGQQFRQQPAVFEQMRNYLQKHHPGVVKQWGYVAGRRQYRNLLASADVVISTALHDFQGLAIIEAVAAGCIPVLPNRLCYSQWFSDAYLYHSYADNSDAEARSLAGRLVQLARRKRDGALPLCPDVSRFCASMLKDEYAQIFAETIREHGQQSVEPV